MNNGNPFFDHPILNSPYGYPERHWELDDQGQPTQKIVEHRRLESGLNRKKPGRSPKVAQPFIVCAGTLWRRAFSESHTKVSDDQLRQIASALDEAGHLPPAAYLEGKFAQEVKAYNSRNSNSKVGPVKTWTQLISLGDKDHLRGIRRLLSRCAMPRNWPTAICPEINSGQKMSSYLPPSYTAGFSNFRCPPHVFADSEAIHRD